MEKKEAYMEFIKAYNPGSLYIAPGNKASFYAGWDAAIKFAQNQIGLPSKGHFEQKLQFWVDVSEYPLKDKSSENDGPFLGFHNWAVTYGNQIAYHNERFDEVANCWLAFDDIKGPVLIKDPEFFLKYREVSPESCNVTVQAFHVDFDYGNYSVNI